VSLPSPSLAHVGIAVERLDEALAFYRDVLGLTPTAPEIHDGARIVTVPLGDVCVELLSPVSADSPIAKFLARRGPGIHHLSLRVPDLDAALAACRAHGYRLVDETPRPGHGGRRVAFVHPKATAGILLELTE
jgi:methylmalonyl-CoA/ethylmalonyl-CoA epimerase